MRGRNAVAELEQAAVKKRRPVLDREIHRVEVVFVQDDRHGLVKHLVHHPVSQQRARRIDVLAKILAERRHKILREVIVVEKDVLAKIRIVAKQVGIGEIRIADRWLDILLPCGQR